MASSEWSWKQIVADEVLKLVNEHGSPEVRLQDIYDAEPRFRERFPRNQYIREKVRQVLQYLRDDGFLVFLGDARYQLNLVNRELELEPVRKGEAGIKAPTLRTVVRTVRLRNTLLASDMKRRYENTCQICRETLRLTDSTYSESHHIKPLGSPHFGPDTEGNILVVCPNHHVMFDRGAVRIDVRSLVIRHKADAFEPRKLYIKKWHALDSRNLNYYNTNISGIWGQTKRGA